MKWWPGDCKCGDIVRVKLGTIYHYGIFISENEVIQFGMPPVNGLFSQKKEDIKVLATDIETFCCGTTVEVAQLDPLERLHRRPTDKIVSNARAAIGSGGYDILHNNCEHFVNQCVLGIKKCSHVDEVIAMWNSRPILDVYISAIPADLSIEMPKQKKRAEELAHTTHPSLKAQKYWDWVVLEHALLRTFGYKTDELEFAKQSNGKWTCDKCFFSLSHTDGFVAVAVSNKATGVDIEPEAYIANKLNPAMINRIRMQSESAQTDNTRLWMSKEAIYKCYGSGYFKPEKTDTAKYNILYKKTVMNNTALCIAVAGDNLPQARFFTYDGSESSKLPMN